MIMKKKIVLTAVILLSVATGIVMFYKGNVVQDIDADRPVPVEVVMVRRGDMVTELAYSGMVEDQFSAMLSSKVNAQVKAVYVTEGDSVFKGNVLAELDHEDFDLKLDTLDAKLNAARINAEYWRDMKNKYASLLKEGAISQQQYSDVDLKYRLAETEIQTVYASIKELEAALNYHYIRAPRDGMVTDVLTAQGDMAMPGKPLMEFSGGKAKKVVVSVIQDDLELINENTPVVIVVGKDRVNTKVSRVLPSIDPMTNTTVVEILWEDNDHAPGMAVEVSFVTNAKKNALLVPSEAVVEVPEGAFVYVIEQDTALLTEITIGTEDADYTEVISGLEVGQGVACGNLNLLRNNGSVYIVGGAKF